MKNSSRLTVAKGFCLLALISIMCGSAFAADHSSETDDQLIAHLQAAVTGNPRTGSRGDQNLGSAIAMAATQGDYIGLERTFMQLKVQLSSDPDSVAIIELLLTRFQAAEAAQTSKRIEELNSITKDLVDKFNSHAPARDYDELLKHISDVAAAAASPYNNMRTTAGAQKIEDTRTFVAQWQEYLIVSAQGNPQQTASILSQLIQLTTHFTVIPRSTLLNLEVTPGTLSEAAIAKEAAEKEKKEQFGKKFIAEIDAAKVPSDLDAVLAEDGPSNRFGAQAFQGYPTKVFVRRWQDYLAAMQAGKVLEAHKILQELAANSDSTFYPRSKILARMSEQAKGAGVRSASGLLMDPASLSLDNLRTLLTQIDALGDQNFFYEHNEGNLRNAVGRLAAAVDQVKTGDLKSGVLATQYNGTTSLTSEQVGEYSQVLTRLYEQIAVTELPGYIDITADLKPIPQERLASYLDRVIRGAVAAKDWHLAFRAAQVRSQIGPLAGNPDAVMADYLGFRAMITAVDKDDASMWTEAVSSYLEALNSTSRLLPIREIGARLKRIKEAHPEDYAKGESAPDYPSMVTRLLEMQRNPPAPRPRPAFPGAPGQSHAGLIPQTEVPPNAPRPPQAPAATAPAN
jgi:hypothetical protein